MVYNVPGSFVREIPGYEGSLLPAGRVTAARTISTAADCSHPPRGVGVSVLQPPGHRPVTQLHHGVGQRPPVRPGGGRHQLDPLPIEERLLLPAAVISHLPTVFPQQPLVGSERITAVGSVSPPPAVCRRKVTDGVPHCDHPVGSRDSARPRRPTAVLDNLARMIHIFNRLKPAAFRHQAGRARVAVRALTRAKVLLSCHW